MIRSAWFLVFVFAFAACSKDGGSAALSKYPGTEEGARQLLTDIRKGDARAMTLAMKPTSADYKAVFVDGAAAKAEEGYSKLWSDPKVVIGADPANTEMQLYKATTEDLQKWEGEAKDHFPGGYKRVADKLKPGLTLYAWKYVKPGEPFGMSYDGLVHANGRWLWFPKPWRAIGDK